MVVMRVAPDPRRRHDQDAVDPEDDARTAQNGAVPEIVEQDEHPYDEETAHDRGDGPKHPANRTGNYRRKGLLEDPAKKHQGRENGPPAAGGAFLGEGLGGGDEAAI